MDKNNLDSKSECSKKKFSEPLRYKFKNELSKMNNVNFNSQRSFEYAIQIIHITPEKDEFIN